MENVCLKIGRKKHFFEFPSSYEELNSKDFVSVFKFVNTEIEESELIYLLMRGKHPKKLAKIDGDYFAEAFLPCLKFLENKLTERWYFDRIEDETIILRGPVDYGTILTGEFAFADTYFGQWKETMDESLLDKCIAVLMRTYDLYADDTSIKWNGDYRVRFNENLIKVNAERVSKISADVKLAFAWNYEIFREYLEKTFIWVFQKSSEGKSSGGWEKVIASMCNGDLTKMDDVAKIPLMTALGEWNDSIKRNSTS